MVVAYGLLQRLAIPRRELLAVVGAELVGRAAAGHVVGAVEADPLGSKGVPARAPGERGLKAASPRPLLASEAISAAA